MKKTCLWLFIGIFTLTGSIGALAQGPPPPGPPMGAVPQAKSRSYDPAKVETLAGEVVNVTRTTPRRTGRSGQVALMLKTDKGTLPVILGPAWYIDQQSLKLKAGDRVEIKGINQGGPRGTSFTATEVQKGGQVLKLRDDRGIPLWRGMKRR
ncbi:MAG: hypothetical protein A2Y80_02015 [Deltaproteobacteria bacterium RBG_13_58_19]|nr:MAG: hypothetical protein A2Y80_02015 [Deltaproteobacteria bacterium RBG_13_58_19]